MKILATTVIILWVSFALMGISACLNGGQVDKYIINKKENKKNEN